MNQQILSQDEVDALLQGITGESQKLEQEEAPTGGIRSYDLSSQERIVRGRMPTTTTKEQRGPPAGTPQTPGISGRRARVDQRRSESRGPGATKSLPTST